MIGRRSLMAGLPAVAVAAAVAPIANAAEPSKGDLLQHYLDTAGPENVALYHLTQLTLAMETIHGGRWRGVLDIRGKFALAIWDEKGPDGVFIKPNGGGI